MEKTKNIISFDVGMKNLAYCIFQVPYQEVHNTDTHTCKLKILKWDVINLCTPIVRKCNTLGCTQDAKYCKTFRTMNEDEEEDGGESEDEEEGEGEEEGEEEEQDTFEKGEKGEKHKIKENKEHEYEIEYFCNKHAKLSKYKVPTPELNIKKIRKMKLVNIRELIMKYNFALSPVEHLASLSIIIDEKGEKGEKPVNQIVNTNSTTIIKTIKTKTKSNLNTKDNLINIIKQELHNNYLEHIENVKAMDVDLITIGKNMMQELDKVLGMGGLALLIDIAIIENQISTIASRMKTLQGMIAQYFIMKHTPHIEFISASNKLKMFMTKKKTTYTERKAESVEITAELLETKEEFKDFKGYLHKNKKKDDLADCFLQGIYYLTLKNMIKVV